VLVKDRPTQDATVEAVETFYTTAQVAEIFGVTGETVRDWIAAKKLQAVRLPTGQYRIKRTALVQFGNSTYEASADEHGGSEVFI
jgi:excisionase family DNA binding protein